MVRKNFHNLTDEERDKLNLPPVGFQGNEFTTIIQAPTKVALQTKIGQFRAFATLNKYELFEVLQQGPDPDGGYKAIVTAHNWNAAAWVQRKWEGRGGGPVARATKEEISRKLRLQRELAIIHAKEAERLRGEVALTTARMRAQYARRLGTTPTVSAPATPSKDVFEDINETIFGKGIKL